MVTPGDIGGPPLEEPDDFDPFTWNFFTFLDPPTDITDHDASIWEMWNGDFKRLAHRLWAAAPLHFHERAFLATLLLDHSSEFAVERRDGRSLNGRRFEESQKQMADHVQMRIQEGIGRWEACQEADARFRSDKTPRPASALAAYRKYYSDESNDNGDAPQE